ncbi:MAG: biotin carboxyl carrier domain-containing protein [Thermomicrobiales bacterium]|nr:biotin carboxyl carrier domain-containing protein [Thermomicrobiales bacterium]
MSHLTIEQPGLFTTVQDLGRPGLARFGVTRGGAIDRTALILGNRLVGNEPGDAGLECTLAGPAIRFETETIFAVTGAHLGATLDSVSIPRWQPLCAPAGSLLSFAPAPIGAGARAYVTVAGGIVTEPALGSRSTDLIGRFGGVEGRVLQAGDRLPLGASLIDPAVVLRRRLAIDPPEYDHRLTIRVVLGPQDDRFTEAGIASFLNEPYQVTSRSDRTGIRLSGPPIEQTNGADLISEGIAWGAIQVPGDGQPIVLLAARQTVGGYVKIATVIGADLDRLGQARSGDELRFTAVSVEEARQATALARRNLDDTAIVERNPDEVGTMSDAAFGDAHGWTPNGVIRVIDAAERAGVNFLRLEIESAGISLELNREAGGATAGSAATLTGDTPASDDQFAAVLAPVLGTFYRRPDPDAEPFVAVGQSVSEGDQIGLIEVMKSYHEVTAPVSGIVTEILADDGHYVEYGQPLASIRKA